MSPQLDGIPEEKGEFRLQGKPGSFRGKLLYVCVFKDFIYLFLESEEGREQGRETWI